MEQSRIEESVSVSPSSVDIFVSLFVARSDLVFSFLVVFSLSCLASFSRGRITNTEMEWVDGRL
jgi:hypothetical protein